MFDTKRIVMAAGLSVACFLPALADEAQPPVLRTNLCSASKPNVTFDLSSVWKMIYKKDMKFLYSSRGWGRMARPDEGKTVALVLTPSGEGNSVVLGEGLSGFEQQLPWTTEAEQLMYTLSHYVVDGMLTNANETLTASFDFSDYTGRREKEDEIYELVKAAVLTTDYPNDPCTLVLGNDATWEPIGGVGEGIRSTSGTQTSVIGFACVGAGTFSYAYALSGGRLVVTVDGEVVKSYDTASVAWISDSVPCPLNGGHEIVLTFTPAADGDVVAVRQAGWRQGRALAFGSSTPVCFDFREGVRTVRRTCEMLPLVYSSTNFVGGVGTAASVACVSVVRLEGEGTDVGAWTNTENEIVGTRTVLVAEAGEGMKTWYGRKGVWKAEFDILPAPGSGETLHHEQAIFDLRKCGYGVMIIIR